MAEASKGEKIVQISSDNDCGERTLYALTSEGRIFASIPKEKGKPFTWHEVKLPNFGEIGT